MPETSSHLREPGFRKSGRLRCIAASAGVWLLGVFAPLACQANEASASTHQYAIERQSLDRALSVFAEQSGVDIVFYQANASGLYNHPVEGRMSPQQALLELLTETGLQARFTSPRSAVVQPENRPWDEQALYPGAPVLTLDQMSVAGLLGGIDFSQYARTLATDISQTVTRASLFDQSDEKPTRIQIRVHNSGQLYDVRIVNGRDRVRDEKIVSLLDGMIFRHKPPADLPQPLIFDLLLR